MSIRYWTNLVIPHIYSLARTFILVRKTISKSVKKCAKVAVILTAPRYKSTLADTVFSTAGFSVLDCELWPGRCDNNYGDTVARGNLSVDVVSHMQACFLQTTGQECQRSSRKSNKLVSVVCTTTNLMRDTLLAGRREDV